MTTIATTFPEDIALREGETLSLDGVARNGTLIVTRVVRTAAPPPTTPPAPDRREAVAAFLRRWTGAGLPGTTDDEMRAQRTARLLAKHGGSAE